LIELLRHLGRNALAAAPVGGVARGDGARQPEQPEHARIEHREHAVVPRHRLGQHPRLGELA